MKNTLFAATLSALLTLAACASAPPYSPAQSAGGFGYTDQRIENDRFRVTYRGAPRMSSADVQDYALMRAAELTIANGGDWFEVIDADTDADARRRYNTEFDYDTRYVVHRSCGVAGCTSRLVPIMVRTEYETVELRTIYEHSMEIRIGTGAKLAGAPNLRRPRYLRDDQRAAGLGSTQLLDPAQGPLKTFTFRSRGFVPHAPLTGFAPGGMMR